MKKDWIRLEWGKSPPGSIHRQSTGHTPASFSLRIPRFSSQLADAFHHWLRAPRRVGEQFRPVHDNAYDSGNALFDVPLFASRLLSSFSQFGLNLRTCHHESPQFWCRCNISDDRCHPHRFPKEVLRRNCETCVRPMQVPQDQGK